MQVIDPILEIVVAGLLIGYVGVVGLTAMMNATSVGANTTISNLVTVVLPILAVIAFLVIIVGAVKKRSGGKKY